jgi:hypothetical protein
MSDEAVNVERMLEDALRPVEPPEDLAMRVEGTLRGIARHASAALDSWADELSEGELEALRDPRNWVRPAVWLAAGGAAATGLVVLGLRRKQRPTGMRASVQRLLEGLRELSR